MVSPANPNTTPPKWTPPEQVKEELVLEAMWKPTMNTVAMDLKNHAYFKFEKNDKLVNFSILFVSVSYACMFKPKFLSIKDL